MDKNTPPNPERERLEELCSAFIEACFCEINSGFFSTVVRPDLNNQHRKELIDIAWTDLERYRRRLMKKLNDGSDIA